MKIIRHRVNTLGELSSLAPGLGAEIDLRSRGSQIVLNHDVLWDANKSVDGLEEFLKLWSEKSRGILILNPKEDGLEEATLDLLRRQAVEDFFFLDLTLPTIVRLACRQGLKKIAIRISEFEPLEGALKFQNRVDWVWVDSFEGAPTPHIDLQQLRSAGFKLCLVSPELQGYGVERIASFLPLKDILEAVCTKVPEKWESR